jgi:hypothetical protein
MLQGAATLPANLAVSNTTRFPVSWVAPAASRLGTSAVVANLDGDAYGDVVIAANGEPSASGALAETGRVCIFYGLGRGSWGRDMTLDDADICFYGTSAGWGLGHSIRLVQIDDDGRDDLLLAAPGASIGSHPYNGVVHVLLSGQSSSQPACTTTCNRPGGYGMRASRLGDVDNDAIEDFGVLVAGGPSSSTDDGTLYVIRGVDARTYTSYRGLNNAWRIVDGAAQRRFGGDLAPIGDPFAPDGAGGLDDFGDTYPDFAVGIRTTGYPDELGTVPSGAMIVAGDATAPAGTITIDDLTHRAIWGEEATEATGFALGGIAPGDTPGDRYLIATSFHYEQSLAGTMLPNTENRGIAWVMSRFPGWPMHSDHPSRLRSFRDHAEYSYVGRPDASDGNAFGYSVTRGDLDGDGGDEIIIGAPSTQGTVSLRAPRVFIFRP